MFNFRKKKHISVGSPIDLIKFMENYSEETGKEYFKEIAFKLREFGKQYRRIKIDSACFDEKTSAKFVDFLEKKGLRRYLGTSCN